MLLAGYFCEKCRVKFGLLSVALSSGCRAMLQAASWPGNVRELEHAIYRAVIIAQAESRNGEVILLPQHFQLENNGAVHAEPIKTLLATPAMNLSEATRKFQYDYIKQVYESCDRVWAKAARKLELDPGNLHRLAVKLGLK